MRQSLRLRAVRIQDWEGTVFTARFRMESPRITGGRHVGCGALKVDGGPSSSGIALVEQSRQRHLHEIGVAEVRLPIGKHQFHSLDDGVEIVRRFVPHPLQVDPFENLQRHVQGWPLAPRSAGIYIVAFVGDVTRRFDPNREGREVFVRQQPPFLNVKFGDFPSDFTLIDQIARCFDSRFPIAPCPSFGVDHPPEGVRQILLEEYLTFLRYMSIGIEDGSRGWRVSQRPAGEGVKLIVDRVTVFGEVERGLDDLLEGHRAVSRQRRQPRVGRCRGNGPKDSGGKVAAILFPESVNACGPGPAPESADGFNRRARSRTIDDRRDTAEMGGPRLEHVDADTGSDTGIGRVAAVFEDTDPAHACQIVQR